MMKRLINKFKFLLYRIKWNLSPYLKLNSPLHLDIEITNRCNLDCSICFRKDLNIVNKDMTINRFDYILKSAKALGVKSLKFNLRGESTLHKHFYLFVDMAKKNGFYVYANTNLSLDYHASKLKFMAKHIDVLKVSIDSINPAKYNKIRQGADFDMTINNLVALEYYREFYKMPKITVSRRISDSVETNKVFKDFFRSFNIKFDIKQAQKRNSKMSSVRNNKRIYCKHPSRRLVVTAEGRVYPCCVCYNSPRDLLLGTINKSSLISLWHNNKRLNLIKDLKNGVYNKSCKDCTSSDIGG